jgi:tetratricopeptide (TPR) repeat protein
VFPAVFGWKQAELCRNEFGSAIAGMRVSQASHALNRLVEISGAEMHQGISLLDWRSKLTQEIAFIRKRLTNPFPKNPSTNDYLERATQLLSLSRYAEAEQLLLDASSSAPQVLLLLAISAREQKEYQKLEMRCRALLDLSSTSQTSASRVDDSLVFQLLGESFIGQRKIKAAIATYEMAIQRDEPDRAELEMRLGSLLAEAGDASGAAEHFEQAARIDRNLSQQANKRIRGLQSNSCKF